MIGHLRHILLGATLLTPLAAPLAAQDQDKRGYLEALLEDALSDAGRSVDIIGFEGALSSTATIDTLTIADDAGIWLQLEEVTLDWNRTALLSGRLEVNALTADLVDLPRLPAPSTATTLPSAEAQPFALPELPVSIDIANLAIAEARFGAPVLGQPVTLRLKGSATLAEGAGTAGLDVTRTDGPEGQIALSASYSNITTEAWIDLSVKEAAGGLVATQLNLPDAPALALTLNGAGPLSDFNATTTLLSDGQERLNGRFTLSADATQPERQTFDATLNGDLTTLFAPEHRAFFGDALTLEARGYAEADVLALSRFDLQAEAIAVSGEMRLEAGWPRLIAIEGQLAHADGSPVRLPLSGAPTTVHSARFSLHHDASRSPDWQLGALLDRFSNAAAQITQAQLIGRGTIAAADFDGALEFAVNGLTPSDPALATATGSRVQGSTRFSGASDSPLHLSDLRMTGADYGLSGDLTLDLTSGALAPDLHLTAANLSRFADLAGIAVSGAGELGITGTIAPLADSFDLTIEGATQDLALAVPRLDPFLTGRADLSLTARRDQSGTEIAPLTLSAPLIELTGSAALRSADSHARLTATVKDLSPVHPDMAGAAQLTLQATQTQADSWQIATSLAAPGDAHFAFDGTIDAALSDAPAITGNSTLQMPDLAPYAALAGQKVTGAFTLEATGSAQPLQQAFDLTATLTSTDPAMENPLVTALLRGQTTVVMQAEKSETSPIVLRQFDLNGREVTASLTGTGDLGSADVRYTARLRDLALLGAGISGAAEATGRAVMRGADWQVDSALTGPGGAQLTTTGTLAQDFTTAALAITGDVPLSLANPLIQPRSLQGNAALDLRLDGPLGPEGLSGRVSLAGARLALPTLRQAVEEISGQIRLTQNRAILDLSARLAAGGGIAINGPVSLTAGNRADLLLELQNIKAQDPSLYSTTLDGALAITGPLSGAGLVRGTLTLGETELRIPANAAPRFASLPGLKHRYEPTNTRRTRRWAGLIETGTSASGPAIGLDLTVNAPSRIFVRGRGLDAELGGSLNISGTTNAVRPDGQFDLIRGRLDILGKRLDLTEGLIQLQGAFDPFLRFVAETQAEDVTAQITIEGPASAPALRFASSPNLPEDEVLALLLFGRDLTTISPLQAVRLAAAIRTLAGQGGEGLTGRLRQGLALDDLDVTTKDDGTTEARLGKYINENIYTEVTADSAGNSQIDLNLQLSPSVTAKGRLGSDGETGIGLFIERDY